MNGSRQAIAVGSVIASLVVLGACASPSPSPSDPAASAAAEEAPVIAGGSVPVPASRTRVLTADDLSADAVDRDELASLLTSSGFVAATESSGADRAEGIHRALVRVIAFETDEGADSYLAWLDVHVNEVIGEADVAASLDVAEAERTIAVHRYVPGDCCPKATIAFLTGWRDGSTVVTLELAGPTVGTKDVAEAATAVRWRAAP